MPKGCVRFHKFLSEIFTSIAHILMFMVKYNSVNQRISYSTYTCVLKEFFVFALFDIIVEDTRYIEV